VALYDINPHYHVPNRPFFDMVELKGGGDATSAARAVIQTGEFDFRPNGSAVFNMGQYICDQMEACQGDSGTGDNSTGTVFLNPGNGAPTQRAIQLVE
jgi:hypothetical protein